MGPATDLLTTALAAVPLGLTALASLSILASLSPRVSPVPVPCTDERARSGAAPAQGACSGQAAPMGPAEPGESQQVTSRAV